MPIPNINLIPPAYYLRKKARAAAIIASLLSLVVIAGMVAFAVMLSQKNTQLKADRDLWRQRAQEVQRKKDQAAQIRNNVAEIKTKTDFITQVFEANDNWPSIFDAIRRYTYPRARYTSMNPGAGTKNITLTVAIPDTPALDAQRAMTFYWSNLLRSPIVEKAVLTSNFLGYERPGGDDTAGSGLPMPGGAPMPGGPSLGPPMPGGPPVGPPMPGGPPVAAAPAGRWLGSPSQVASPAIAAAGGAEANLIQMLGPGGQGLTPEALQQFGITVPRPPRTVPFTFSVELNRTFTVPEYKAAPTTAAPDEFGGGGVVQDEFTPTPIQ